MKLLICAHDRPDSVNGPNVWLQRLLPELRDEGIESKLLFFPVGDPGECPTLQALKKDGFPCKVYTGLRFTEHQMRWILKQVKANPPDIFLPNLNIPAYYASEIIKKAGIPTVGMLHSDDSFYRSIVEEFVMKPDKSFLSALVCVSQFLQDYCKDKSSGKLELHKIPYGVPIPDKKARFDDEKLKLLYAGRFIERQKRISDVTDALCKLTEKIPGTKAILYGSGPSEQDIRKILEEHKTESVKLGGLVDSKELQSRFLENQVFVLLSDYEGLPIALMEAMAAGLVPVCYKMDSGIPELVTDGENGLIVDDRGVKFINAIKRLKEETGFWEKLSEGARRKIEQGYSIPYMKRQWKQLFLDLVESKTEKVKEIEIPDKISLPPRNPSIRNFEDRRWPGYPTYLRKRIKMLAGRVFSGKN